MCQVGKSVEFGLQLARIGLSSCQNLVDPGRNWPSLVECVPNVCIAGPDAIEIDRLQAGPISTEFGSSWAELGRCRAKVVNVLRHFGNTLAAAPLRRGAPGPVTWWGMAGVSPRHEGNLFSTCGMWMHGAPRLLHRRDRSRRETRWRDG